MNPPPRYLHIRIRWLALAIILLLALALFVWKTSDNSAATSVPEHTSTAAAEQAQSNSRPPSSVSAQNIAARPYASRSQADLAALPPPDTPLQDSLPILIQLADEGNARAACSLSAQIYACTETLAQAREAVNKISKREAQKLPAPSPESWDAKLEQIAVDSTHQLSLHCQNLDIATLPSHQASMLQSAEMGFVPAMRMYALLDYLYVSPIDYFSTAPQSSRQSWQPRAETFLRRAAQQGDTEALRAMVFNYGMYSALRARDKEIPVWLTHIPSQHEALTALYALRAIERVQNPASDDTSFTTWLREGGQLMSVSPKLQEIISNLGSQGERDLAAAEADAMSRGWSTQVFQPKLAHDPSDPMAMEQFCREP